MDAFEISHLRDWIIGLNKIISDITCKGREPIVIAISRKMPRLFDWLKYQDDESLLSSIKHSGGTIEDFVNKLNLTTEYALPFLFKEKQEDKYDVIVVDDIIIHGHTLRQVSSDICALTGKYPVASAIFKCENVGTFPYANTSFIDEMRPLTKEEEGKASRFISQAILSTSLPMDMVYPIFHVSREFARKFHEILGKQYESSTESYPISHEKSSIPSETIMLDKYIDFADNNDFAKCRSFHKQEKETLFVVYAPNVIEEEVILFGCPFTNEAYSKIWADIKRRVETVDYAEVKDRMKDSIYSFAAEKRIAERIALSLGAFANYLFSISIINHILLKSGIGDTVERQLNIQESDLRLLLGETAASDVSERINNLLKDYEISPFKREQIVVETSLCPKDFKETYEQYKNIIVQRSNSLDEVLNDIFDLQRHPEKIGLYLSPSISPESVGIAESFQSMIALLSKFKTDNVNIPLKVNEYIDRKIDEGAVSSFYSRTESRGKILYIKRFFRAGSNSMI